LRIAADAYGLLTFGNLDFGDAGLVEQFDKFLYFSDVHLGSLSPGQVVADSEDRKFVAVLAEARHAVCCDITEMSFMKKIFARLSTCAGFGAG
jgi:hypothetical protein